MHTPDAPLAIAIEQVTATRAARCSAPRVNSFFHEPTFTVTHLVHDPRTRSAAIIDSVLDFESASGRVGTASAERLADFVRDNGLTVEWLLETHAHADHLSAAPHLRKRLGGKLGIGRRIVEVQRIFAPIFNMRTSVALSGADFDCLFDDGSRFTLGGIPVTVLSVPGHTPADVAYVIGDAVFTGDTLFMPDYGTARADFPGGDAQTLYRSIRRLLSLPDPTRLFLCHDYKAPGRENFAWETTVGAERASNVHVRDGVAESDFVTLRQRRDATLPMPALILPSIQVNIRAGKLPPRRSNGRRYLKIPLDSV